MIVNTKKYSIIKNVVIVLCCFFLIAPTNIFAKKEEHIKTNINDLLNTTEKVISPADIPELDRVGSKLLINSDNGQILYSEDGEYPLPIYSVTKVLSVFIFLDKLAENKPDFQLDTKIKAEGRPVLVSYETGFSNLSLIEDQEYTVEELLESVIIHSANASTMLLGQHIAGGEKEFVEMMRKKASDLGLKQTSIFSSTGLDKNDLKSFGYDELEDGVNSMSAVDVAYMTMQLLKVHPEITKISTKTTGIFGQLTDNPYEYDTTVSILPGAEHGIDGVTGLKTGGDIFEYTSSIVFTATREATNLIGVIIKSRTPEIRTDEAARMLEYGFDILNTEVIFDKNSLLFGNGKVKTKFTLDRSLAVEVSEPLILTHSKQENFVANVKFIPTSSKYNEKKNAFNGPIKKGEILGKIVFVYEDISFITPKNVDEFGVEVIASEDSTDGFVLFNAFEWLFNKVESIFDK